MATENRKTHVKIGVIIGSQRPLRAGPQIANFVVDVITAHEASSSPSSSSGRPVPTIELIDVQSLGLPLLDEPGMAATIRDGSGYANEHTRAWSRLVSSLDGVVVVSPQYNWGVPAGLKNAVDYLYHEWAGKPAAVVTYGGHGGDKCAAALALVLGGGLRMRVVEPPVCLAFDGREKVMKAAAGEDLGLDAASDEGMWRAEERGRLVEAWEKLMDSF